MLRLAAPAAFALLGLFVAQGLAQQPTAAALVARADSVEARDPAQAMKLAQRALSMTGSGSADQAARLRALRIRCWAAAEAAPDSLRVFATDGLAAAERMGDPAGIARMRVCRGYSREVGGDQPGAIADYEEGVAAGRRLGDDELLADALVLRGETEYDRGDFKRSVEDLNEAYKLYTALGKQSRVDYTLNAMANLYADQRMGQYDRALEYYRLLLKEHDAAGRQREVATAYFNIGSTLERMNRLDDALAEYRRGLAMDLKRGDADEVATDRRAVGVVLYKLGRPAEALRELDVALAYRRGTSDREEIARAQLSRGVALRMLKRTRESIADLEAARAHFTATKNRRFLEKIHEELALAYADAGDLRAAYDARGEQLALQKALEGEAREEQSARLRVQFESDRREQENQALIRIRRLQMAVIGLAAVVIIALSVFGVRQILAARRLRVLALVDELTQVPNRRAIMELAEEQARSAGGGGPGFAILALDIDHFKRVNDDFGHEAGDTVLKRVAQISRMVLRPGDHIGRTGGEEFVVILPGAAPEAAREVAERLRSAIERSDFADVAPGSAVTVSIGAAVWSASDRSVAELYRRADESLYQVKRSGRNQVFLTSV